MPGLEAWIIIMTISISRRHYRSVSQLKGSDGKSQIEGGHHGIHRIVIGEFSPRLGLHLSILFNVLVLDRFGLRYLQAVQGMVEPA